MWGGGGQRPAPDTLQVRTPTLSVRVASFQQRADANRGRANGGDVRAAVGCITRRGHHFVLTELVAGHDLKEERDHVAHNTPRPPFPVGGDELRLHFAEGRPDFDEGGQERVWEEGAWLEAVASNIHQLI